MSDFLSDLRSTFPSMSIWHPWRHLADNHPEIIVSTRHELPGTMMGYRRGNRIWLCRTLNQAERRSTLTHELQHLWRGPVPRDSHHATMREEQIVSALAARQLIPLAKLVDALRWTRDEYELADELWVDAPTVRCRIQCLDPIETAELEHHLNGEWL